MPKSSRQPPKTENPVGLRILARLDGRGVPWLAKATGMSLTTMHDQIRSGPAKVDSAASIAAALDVSLGWLLTGEGADTAVSRDVVSVPVYDIQVAAGAGRTIDDRLGSPVFRWSFSREWAEANLQNVDQLRMFSVSGDSQEPELSRDDLVAVDVSVRAIREGLFVVRLDDQLLIKRLQPKGSSVVLVSRNPAYPPMEVRPGELGDGFEVIGRAVWASKML